MLPDSITLRKGLLIMDSVPLNHTSPDPPRSQVSKSILVADDDEDIRKLLTATLGREGYQVSCTKDGEEAWAQLNLSPVDLLITDHDMPVLKGLDLLRRLRRHSLRLPVILMSGYMPWNEVDLDTLTPGVALPKPFSISVLRERVRELLDRCGGSLAAGGARAQATHIASNQATLH